MNLMSKGFIECPISNFVYTKDGLGEMKPQKLFNYILQNLETSHKCVDFVGYFSYIDGDIKQNWFYTHMIRFLFDYDESESEDVRKY